MGFAQFLRRLVGIANTSAKASSKTSIRPRSVARDASFSSSVLSVDSLRFFGSGRQSRNKRWVVGGMDRPPSSKLRPGELHGRAVLVGYPADRVAVVVGGFSRPMECAVPRWR